MIILDETTWEMFWDITFGKDPKIYGMEKNVFSPNS